MAIQLEMAQEEVEKDATEAAKKHTLNETKEIELFIEDVTVLMRDPKSQDEKN